MKKLVSLLLAIAMLTSYASALAEITRKHRCRGMPIVDEPITISVLTMRWGSMGDLRPTPYGESGRSQCEGQLADRSPTTGLTTRSP